MKFSKSTKYWWATACFFLVAAGILRMLMDALRQPRDGSERLYFYIVGPLLVGALIVSVAARQYYRRDRNSVVDETETASELTARSLLHAGKSKHVTITLAVTADEQQHLQAGKLVVVRNRFTGPIRRGDIVRACVGEGSTQYCSYGRIELIDGVNQRVEVQPAATPR
jgi:hypothetical protein